MPDTLPPSIHERTRTLLARVIRVMLSIQRGVGLVLWCVPTLWTTLLIWFWMPGGRFIQIVSTLAVTILFTLAARERTLIGWKLQPWKQQRLTLIALGVMSLSWALYLPLVRPIDDIAWTRDQARQPRLRLEGNFAHVSNVRSFLWRTPADADERWLERTYDLSKIERMYYVIVPLSGLEAAAHVFVSFSFSDGQAVSISVEGRRPLGEPYEIIPSMFRKYQIVYIVGDEQDVLGLRGTIWQQPVRFYPARAKPETVRKIFLSMLKAADAAEDNPEFYHLLINNCLTNITRHIRTLDDHALPSDTAMLLTGWSDRVAYELDYIDTDRDYDQMRQVFRVDDWMQTAPLNEEFSKALREVLHERTSRVSSP